MPALLLSLLVVPLAVGCGSAAGGGGVTTTPPADSGSGSFDTGPDVTEDTADAGVPKLLRWQQYIPSHGKKLRAIAPDPTQPGAYVAVGDGGSVVRFADGNFEDLSIGNIGGADLHGVHVDAKGRIIAAGDKSALAIREDGNWLVAGEVPPAPAVNFLNVDGDGDTYWAVGADLQAWKHFDAAWAAQAVTVTEGEDLGLGAQLAAVAVTKSDVWIAADPGSKSPGLLLRQVKGGWKAFSLPVAARDVWASGGSSAGEVYVAGGTNDAFVARFDGKAFVPVKNLKWTQGFHALTGLGADTLWVAGFKGQLRSGGKDAWEVLTIEAPPGTPQPFPPPTQDLVGVAVSGAEELAVVTNYRMYRYGKQ